jgi:transcriptional regulator with XRE-family HTH domain
VSKLQDIKLRYLGSRTLNSDYIAEIDAALPPGNHKCPEHRHEKRFMSNPTSHPLSRRISEEADLLKDALSGALRTRRKQLGISQMELADRIDVRRQTVLEGELHRANISLSVLVRWVRALNLTATLNSTDDELPNGHVHCSLWVNRRRYDLREEQRECALAESWEHANQRHSMGLGAILPTLVPGITPSQASVAATVIQWLGSELGFDFLRRTLAIAGYAIVDVKHETVEG